MLSDDQRTAVLSGHASWFESSCLTAAERHARTCPSCEALRIAAGQALHSLSTKTMCETGRRIAIGQSEVG